MAEDPKQEVLVRLKKIEGQVRGLQRLIDQGKDCAEVVHQITAARKALDKVGFIVVAHLMRDCLKRKSEADADRDLQAAMELFLSLS